MVVIRFFASPQRLQKQIGLARRASKADL